MSEVDMGKKENKILLGFLLKIIQANHDKEMELVQLFKSNIKTNIDLYKKLVEYSGKRYDYTTQDLTDHLVSEQLGFETHRAKNCQNSMCEIGQHIELLLNNEEILESDLVGFINCLADINFQTQDKEVK